MRAAITKTEIESAIASRFSDAFRLHEKRPAEVLSSGVTEIDSFIGGLPRGAITEIYGPASSGRTILMLATMAHATSNEEVCALIDTSNVFDPHSAAEAGMTFDRLLWVRCANNLEHAFKATDLILQAGGFGLVILDLGDVPAKSAKRIISSWWYRFRRTLESTPTALVVIVEDSAVKSCAVLALELKAENGLWLDEPTHEQRRVASISSSSVRSVPRQVNYFLHPHANLLKGMSYQVNCQRPLHLTRSTKSHEGTLKSFA